MHLLYSKVINDIKMIGDPDDVAIWQKKTEGQITSVSLGLGMTIVIQLTTLIHVLHQGI